VIVLPESGWLPSGIAGVTANLPESKKVQWEAQAGKLAFKYMRAEFHLAEIRRCYQVAISEHSAHISQLTERDNVCSSYNGAQADSIFFHLEAFLEAARAAHDSTLASLHSAKVLLQDPGISLSQYCKKPVPESAPAIDGILRTFWSSCGERTKAYRDSLVHYASLSGLVYQTAINMQLENGSWQIRLFLPDNPESNSYGAFTFNKRIEAVALCDKILSETRTLLAGVLNACLAKWGAEPSPASFTIKGVVIGE